MRTMKPVQPDAVLGALVGTQPMPRTEITSRLWDYIRRGQLQGTNGDRRVIYAHADAAFRAFLDGNVSCTMFELQKFVSAHVAKIEG